MKNILKCILVLIFGTAIYGENNPYQEALDVNRWKSVQKYLMVRPGVHLFYWLYYADGTIVGAYQKPLMIWIQGGPGLAATGVANFAEIGPLDMNMNPRNHTWVKGNNVLLIDHPVGTGFSYATNTSLYVKTDREAVIDLNRAIKMFFRRHKDFRKTPAYLFGQSYGGKLLPRLAYHLDMAIKKRQLMMNFKGIGIGSGWTDPKESTLIQPEFLYNMGIIDQNTYQNTKKLARTVADCIDKKDYNDADTFDELMFDTLTSDKGIDNNMNNINQISPYYALEQLNDKVNLYVKPTLKNVNQTFKWQYFSNDVSKNLKNNFLISSSKFLEQLLNKTDLTIVVYNGNLDAVTPLAGASNWVHKLKWHGAEEFKLAKRNKIRGERNGFFKTAYRLSFWSVFGSGHWIPEDNPVAMRHILDFLVQESK